MTDEKVPTMLTIRETAERTGLSYGIVRRLCLRREIVTVKSGRKTYVNFDRFVDYLNGERKKTE
ncbi:MAG: helix-turn-helix domain-containing protein [Solobacterium sp.]|nr:helix-turn-helix domain-containing protein [Solobacterium sp.]